MIAHRVFAVCAAVFLVSTVAVATFGSQAMSLGDLIYLVDQDLLLWLTKIARRILGDLNGDAFLRPLLMRPAWLLPASAGLIFVGLAVSTASRKPPHRSRKRS